MQTGKILNVQRHELKFYLSHADYEYARVILREMMERDEHSPERGYPLRSLYFDDIADTALLEKLDGVEFRDKYRLRSYGPEYPWVKLERKRKHNNYVQKTSVVISNEDAKKLIAGDASVLLQNDDPAARSIYFDFARRYMRPVVLIDYVREAYTLPYNEVRITFDKELSASTHDLDMFDAHTRTRQIEPHEVIIMEVKYNVALPSWFKEVFKFESGTSSAISKYTYGRIGVMEYML